MEFVLTALPAGGLAAAVAAVCGLTAAAALIERAGRKNRLNLPPAVPGLPIIGNLHQLKEKKPHQTFANWAKVYGPIYTIRTGASFVAVLNSTEVAKEAMVAKYLAISTRKLSTAVSVLTRDKKIVAMSDHGDFHKLVKRYIMMSMLGASAQKQFRGTRDTMIDNMMSTFNTLVTNDPKAHVNFRNVFKTELFRLSMTQVDWRDFFPYLSWLPNRSFEAKLLASETTRTVVARALINQQKERITRGEARVSYLDYLLAENKLTDEQVLMLVWEAILEAADTTLVTTEWAMYELAKNLEKQERLYQEIQEVCGKETVTEDHLPQLPYLNAVFHETLRRHSAVPLVPPRFVHENTTLAGYDIPAGTEVIINLYACNMNKNDWDDPEEWKPERFLDGGGRLDTSYMYKTMAFGAGRRVCAGSMQATNIACTSIARFIQEFTWKLKEGDEDKVDTLKVTAFKLHSLCVYLTPRGRK